MGGGVSRQHMEEMKKLEHENAQLKRETQFHMDQVRKLMLQVDSTPNRRTFLTKKKRLAVSSEVLNKLHNDEEKIVSFVPKVVVKPPEVTGLLTTALFQNILFQGMPRDVVNKCVAAFEQEPILKAGTKLIKQGEALGDATKFYVLESGILEIDVDGTVVSEIQEGSGVGELALMYNQPRAATVIAKTDCYLWSLDRDTFQEIKVVLRVKRTKRIEGYLRSVELLSVLRDDDLTVLANSMEEMAYEDGACIIRQGASGDQFYIVEEGTVSIFKQDGDGPDKLVQTCVAGSYFGERALLSEDKRAATCIAKGNVVCLVLDRSHFEDLIGSLKAYSSGEVSVPAYTPRQQEAVELVKKRESIILAESLDFNLLENVGILGEGAFGRVSLVRNKNDDRKTGKTYALKAMQKGMIKDNHLEEHTVNEVNVMKMMNHPVLLRLYSAYQDKKYLYLLIELCQGGELFAYLRDRITFNEEETKFYAAGVTLGFEALHKENIAYRDLKPENLLLDSKGFLKICDFGLAKVVTDKTFTLCGTPDYLAPEIITSQGHNKACDYWALGILIYELITGEAPFYAEDPMQIYQLILRHHLSFPYRMTRQCKDIISKLLESNQSARLGVKRNGTKDVLKHKWFQGFDFDALVTLDETKLKIPIVPDVKDPCDCSHFDISDISDEEPAPISSWSPSGFIQITE